MNISLFGPLDKSYCEIFQYLGIFLIIFFVFQAVGLIMYILNSNSKDKIIVFLTFILSLVMVAIKYMFLGLLYNMCKNVKK